MVCGRSTVMLANDGEESSRGAAHHLRYSAKTMCCSQFIIIRIFELGIGRRPAGRAGGCAQAP